MDSQSDPADYASRAFSITETHKLQSWLSGPALVYKEEREWPKQPAQIPDLSEEDCELKPRKLQVHGTVQKDCLQPLLSHFSSFYKLQISDPWLLSFKEYLRARSGRVTSERPKKGNLMVGEITKATEEIVKVIQCQEFPNELAMLQKIPHEPTTSPTGSKLSHVGSASPLCKLCPQIHEGIICVGG